MTDLIPMGVEKINVFHFHRYYYVGKACTPVYCSLFCSSVAHDGEWVIQQLTFLRQNADTQRVPNSCVYMEPNIPIRVGLDVQMKMLHINSSIRINKPKPFRISVWFNSRRISNFSN